MAVQLKHSLPLLLLSAVLLLTTFRSVHVSLPAFDQERRRLSTYLGHGKCEWTLPEYNVSEDLNFTKTLIVGFPSGDKRLAFVQMEALTGYAAKDEWDFEYLGITNEPFIKANYPHHEGIWGWGQEADQVVMVMRNIRRSMVEYHDILWDIDYAKTWDVASLHKEKLYDERPPLEDFVEWRDERVLDEIHWYGWFIDYWMEGGLMRDMFTTKITTPEHWNMLMMPTVYRKAEMEYDLIVGNATVTPTYDPHCVTDVSGGCKPIEIISAERLVKPDTGPSENRKIAQVLANKTGFEETLIPEDAWECIWTELIINKKGLKTFVDRDSLTDRDYNFSEEMLDKMIAEVERLITKYSGPAWNSLGTANTLVDILSEHLDPLRAEHAEVRSGMRRLRNNDFLGPKTRAKREKEKKEGALYW